MAFTLTPSTIGDSLRNATGASTGDVYAPNSDCYNTVIIPALQFSVETHGKPTTFSVVFESSASGTFGDAVTVATITQADSPVSIVENAYPSYLRARLASISGGINPAITARIRVITENKAVADVISAGSVITSGSGAPTDPPASGVYGYFDTATGALYLYISSAWKQVVIA